jgi:hypothetical protein
LAARKNPNVVNVFFVLVSLRVEVKGSGVSYVATRIVRNDRNIIAYLVLVWIAFEWIKRIAHSNIRSPSDASISAPGVK